MTVKKSNNLPTFGKPPVIEVVMGVQFETLENFCTPHIGLLWDFLDRKKYPAFEEATPIDMSGESFRILEKPAIPRILFISENNETIVQFQRDRFLYNWRKYNDNSEYPRYKSVKESFYSNFENLEKCLKELKISPLNPQRLELTYLNIVPLDKINGISNIGNILKDIAWNREHKILPSPQKIGGYWQFLIGEISSLLDLRVNNIILPTGQEVVKIELTIRGQAPSNKIKECESWFDTARRIIVTGFVDVTTGDAHNIWGGLSYE